MTSRLVEFVRRHPRLLKVARYLQWKRHILSDWAGTHLFKRKTSVKTPFGFRLVAGQFLANRLMQAGAFEPEETRLIRRSLDDVDVFVDVGANIGYYVCLARSLGKHVVAFEPQPRNNAYLLQNLEINDWSDVEVFPLALSDEVGVAELFGSSGPSASMIKGWAGYPSLYRQAVPVNLLDNVIGNRFHGRRLLIKIDVEGVEYSVLRGAMNLLKNQPRPIWFVEICLHEFHPNGINPNYRDTFGLFFDHGYRAFAADGDETEITAEDVGRWVARKRCDLPVFNYLMR